MSRLIIVMALLMATASILISGPVSVSVPPPSIRLAFQKDHPNAGQPLFRFSADDAGSFFQVAFEESGTHQVAEYRYTHQDWLQDEAKVVAMDGDKDGYEESEVPLMTVDSGTHKR